MLAYVNSAVGITLVKVTNVIVTDHDLRSQSSCDTSTTDLFDNENNYMSAALSHLINHKVTHVTYLL